jgi:Spy/CpxP family protein refolding chaperone
MKYGIGKQFLYVVFGLMFVASIAAAQDPGRAAQRDAFAGRLFPPNVIMEHQDELNLSKEQFTAIRAAVVEVQANVAEHEWDMREAYQNITDVLDEVPIDEDAVMQNVDAALRAENEVKKLQVSMLIKLRTLLTDEQTAYLQSLR